MAYSIVSVYGMNEKLGNISFYDSKSSEYNFNKPYSEHTAQLIDEEVNKIIAKAYERTKKLLTDKKAELEILAKELLDKEILFQADLEKLIGKRPFDKETTYQAFTNKKETPKVDTISTEEAKPSADIPQDLEQVSEKNDSDKG